jgi:hypothetical protein
LLTDIGICTRESVVQGSTDAAHAFQAGMYESIDCLLFQFVLIWVDDLLVYSKSFEQQLQSLGKVFERLRKFNFKFSPKKSELFALHIIWCGRKISKGGVSFGPTSRDFQRSPVLKRLSSCCICLALSTGLEAQFQTMPVTWHHYKKS